MSDNSVITISPKSKRNALTLTLLGCALLLITLAAAQFWWQAFRLQLIVLLLVSSLVIFLGILKSYEPKVSLVLTRDNLIHVHLAGKWVIGWQDIKRIGRPTFTQGIEQITLPYIGIKLGNLAKIASHISPRLANKLIHEQRDLVMFNARAGNIAIDDIHINFSPYKLEDKVLKGPVAAWLHRCELLDKACGYHLFISTNSLDRDPENFEKLLTQCWHHSSKQ